MSKQSHRNVSLDAIVQLQTNGRRFENMDAAYYLIYIIIILKNASKDGAILELKIQNGR